MLVRYAAKALQSRGCLVAASLRGRLRAVGAELWADRSTGLEPRQWLAIDWIVSGARRLRAERDHTRAHLAVWLRVSSRPRQDFPGQLLACVPEHRPRQHLCR